MAATFEENIAKLEEIVRALEGGQMSLEDSINAYEEGMKLCDACTETLQACQQRINRINPDGSETPLDGE